MADWQTYQLQIPGEDILEPIRGMLETLLVFLEIIKTVLEVIQTFLVDFGNPVKALLLVILALVQSIFESLKRTGLFAWYDTPDPTKDPNFYRNVGGYEAFTQRFKGGLFDTKDPNRPQPLAGSNKSGFVLLVVDSESVHGLLNSLKALYKLFGKELTQPQYAPPTNVRVSLANSKSQPLLRVRDIFSDPPKSLVLEWGLADAVLPPDPGFSDMAAQVGAAFVPQKFLIERSTVQNGTPIVSSVQTDFGDKKGKRIQRQVQVVDEHGDPIRTYQDYIVFDPASVGGILGNVTGKFRYIDTNVKPDVTYYYRVRAFSGDLALNGTALEFKPETTPQKDLVAHWPAANPSAPPVIGRPSNVVSGRIPTLPPAFDVVEVLEAIFLSAFSLGFGLPADPEARFNPDTGLPIDPATNSDIGKGSLADQAGPLSNLIPSVLTQIPKVDAISKKLPDVTFQFKNVQFKSASLANTVANALLENSANLTNFKTFMEGSLPYALTNRRGYVDGSVTNLTKLVFALKKSNADYKDNLDTKLYETADFAYTDPYVRLNVLAAVKFIKSFTLGGTPPDWQSISIFRDIIPWSGALIYEIIAKIDALLDAFKGALDEIQAFIDLLIKKIEVLENFIKFLVSILDLLLSLSVGFYLLSATGLSSLDTWIQAIDNAGGNKPPSRPGGYTGGVAFAYVAPDVTAFETAFGIIF